MKPTLQVVTESGAVYAFSEGMARVRCDRDLYDALTEHVIPARRWVSCEHAYVAVGQGMRLGADGATFLSTPVIGVMGLPDGDVCVEGVEE